MSKTKERSQSWLWRLGRILLATTVAMLVPLIAMQFIPSVQWGVIDFVLASILLIAAGLLYELVASRIKPKLRLPVGVLIVGIVLIIWIELAVGLFASPFAGN